MTVQVDDVLVIAGHHSDDSDHRLDKLREQLALHVSRTNANYDEEET